MEILQVAPLNLESDFPKTKTQLIPRVLIVEDDVTLEPIWAYIVERANEHAVVTWATSEAEAEELICKAMDDGKPFDLVITDIFLSGAKTGIDLWDVFHKSLNEKVILTSAIEYDNFVKYLAGKEGCPTYIQKPFSIHDCIETVYGMLQKAE